MQVQKWHTYDTASELEYHLMYRFGDIFGVANTDQKFSLLNLWIEVFFNPIHKFKWIDGAVAVKQSQLVDFKKLNLNLSQLIEKKYYCIESGVMLSNEQVQQLNATNSQSNLGYSLSRKYYYPSIPFFDLHMVELNANPSWKGKAGVFNIPCLDNPLNSSYKNNLEWALKQIKSIVVDSLYSDPDWFYHRPNVFPPEGYLTRKDYFDALHKFSDFVLSNVREKAVV